MHSKQAISTQATEVLLYTDIFVEKMREAFALFKFFWPKNASAFLYTICLKF